MVILSGSEGSQGVSPQWSSNQAKDFIIDTLIRRAENRASS